MFTTVSPPLEYMLQFESFGYMQLNVYDGVSGIAVVSTMAAGIVVGLLDEAPHIPYTALAATGLVWYLACRREAPWVVIGYAMLGACVLLAVAAYGDTKRILDSPDVFGVVSMAAGLTGLAAVSRWAVSCAHPALRV